MDKTTHADALDIFLQPGDFYFGDKNTRIRTILGSCISITMWHPQRCIGGMCHYMLPSRGTRVGKRLDGRYADEALQMFMREIRAAGTSPDEYHVKLFGGGNMFRNVVKEPLIRQNPRDRGDCRDVSCRNRETAYQLIQHYGFALKAEHLGGSGHRQVIFDIASGHAWVRHSPIATDSSGRKKG